MSATWADIVAANDAIRTTTIERKDKDGKTVGKEYAEVAQRVKAFRMVYPQGTISTEMIQNENGICIFKAVVMAGDQILATGMAYEKESSSFINKTSYIENCETSAVGRALGFAGFGIDTSIASAEEVQNATLNQKPEEQKPEERKPEERKPAEVKKASPHQIEILRSAYKGKNLQKLLESNGIQNLEDLPLTKASYLIAMHYKRKEQKDANRNDNNP